jgi:putative ATP-dependent endonuclease of OLD family
MRITRVQIRNWRSIKDVDFYPSDATVLVGPNNAGKG